MYSNRKPEIGVGLGMAMGHLAGVLDDSNLFSRRRKQTAERPSGFPAGDDYIPLNDINACKRLCGKQSSPFSGKARKSSGMHAVTMPQSGDAE